LLGEAGVPEKPIVFRVPPECPHCGAEDGVRLQHTIKGPHDGIMEWRCAACNAEWVVRQEDEHRST